MRARELELKLDGVTVGRFDSESSLFGKWEATERKEMKPQSDLHLKKNTLDVELIDKAQEWKPFPLSHVNGTNLEDSSIFQL